MFLRQRYIFTVGVSLKYKKTPYGVFLISILILLNLGTGIGTTTSSTIPPYMSTGRILTNLPYAPKGCPGTINILTIGTSSSTWARIESRARYRRCSTTSIHKVIYSLVPSWSHNIATVDGLSCYAIDSSSIGKSTDNNTRREYRKNGFCRKDFHNK